MQIRRPIGLLPAEVDGHLTSHYAAALELMPTLAPGQSRLLELGAGHCEIARLLRDRGWQVHTADLEASCVAEAIALGFSGDSVGPERSLAVSGRRLRFCGHAGSHRARGAGGSRPGRGGAGVVAGRPAASHHPQPCVLQESHPSVEGKAPGDGGGALPVLREDSVGSLAGGQGVPNRGSELLRTPAPHGRPMGAEALTAKAGTLPNSRVAGVQLCHQFRVARGAGAMRSPAGADQGARSCVPSGVLAAGWLAAGNVLGGRLGTRAPCTV